MKKKKHDAVVACPHCGEMIKKNAPACPYCGSDERTGWSDSTYLDGISLPDDTSYDEIAAKEFGSPHIKASRSWWKSWQVIIAAAVLLLFALAYLRAIL